MPKTLSPPDVVLADITDPLLDYQQGARYLGVSTRWLKRCVEEKRVSYIKLNRLVRFRQSELDRLLAASTVEAAS